MVRRINLLREAQGTLRANRTRETMVRLFHAYFPARTLLLGATETIVAYLALLAITYARLGSESSLFILYENGWTRIALVCLICVICLYYFDLYDSLVLTNTREVVTRLVQVLGTTCIILAVIYYLYPSIQIGTSLFVPGVLFMGFCLVLWRKMFAVLNRSSRLAERTVVLGDGPLALPLAKELESRPELGFHLVGFVGQPPTSPGGLNGMKRLGNLDDLGSIIQRAEVDRVVVTMSDRRGKLPIDQLLHLKTRGVLIEDGAAFYETITGRVPIDSLRVSHLLFSPGFRVSRPLLAYKRLFSFFLSLVSLIMTLPFMAGIALAIWWDSGRPILFRQRRVGKDGKVFILYKFRSMRNQTNGNGKPPEPAKENDLRFTRVGGWLRRTRLDELPQLYNILKGDMSFVGPRPFMLEEEEELAREIPFYKQRWAVKPGATGWAQIHRPYCVTLDDNREKLSYDLFYIKNISVGLDLLIIFQTVRTLIWRRGAR
jgi:sugar transferase (PEP-CTERM system associated)